MTTPTAQLLGVQAESEQSERDRTAAASVERCLLCQRHELDPLDAAFAHLAPGYPTEVAS